MKLWRAATALLALGGAVFGAAFVGARWHLRSDGLTAALADAPPPREPRRSEASAHVRLATSAAARSTTSASTAVPAPVTPESLPTALTLRQTNTQNGNVVFVPEDCRGPYDVLLHFHGAHPYVRELIEKAGLRAVVATYNAGNGAERYAQAFQAAGVLSSLLRQIEAAAAPLCAGPSAGPRRIALSAWSAGYGAVEKLITRPEDRDRVDAVLLADGLHAGFTDPWKRQFAPNALLAFREFGELAKADRKLFSITHSTIATDGYASTTECSRLLLRELGVPSEGPFVSGKLGGFSIEGSPGEDAPAHVAQFRRMDVTLLPKLRARWEPSAAGQ